VKRKLLTIYKEKGIQKKKIGISGDWVYGKLRNKKLRDIKKMRLKHVKGNGFKRRIRIQRL